MIEEWPLLPVVFKARRFSALCNELAALNCDPANPLPALERGIQLHTEQLEVIGQIQMLLPGEPVNRVLKHLETALEANVWIRIQYLDHTDETKHAETVALDNCDAHKLTEKDWDQFWDHIGLPAGPLTTLLRRYTQEKFDPLHNAPAEEYAIGLVQAVDQQLGLRLSQQEYPQAIEVIRKELIRLSEL
jgi:hypothetical protein